MLQYGELGLHLRSRCLVDRHDGVQLGIARRGQLALATLVFLDVEDAPPVRRVQPGPAF